MGFGECCDEEEIRIEDQVRARVAGCWVLVVELSWDDSGGKSALE